MGSTICTSCGRSIGYSGATVCPYCGSAIGAATASKFSSSIGASPRAASTPRLASTLGPALPLTPSSAATPATVPPSADRALQQLREGLRRLLDGLDSGQFLEIELALSQIAIAVTVLRSIDHWEVADAGLESVLREFLAHKPSSDARGERIRALQELLKRLLPSTAKAAGDRLGLSTRSEARPSTALISGPNSLLSLVDAWAFEEFDLARIQAGPLTTPSVYCATFEEFFASFFAFRNLSPEEQARSVQEEARAAREAVAQGGGAVLGVNWPGHGCFLNGEAFARIHAKESAAEALRCPKTFPHILSTAIHEKLGHGLLTEFTTRGRELRSVHLEQHDVARQFLRRKSDDPREALLLDKWDLLLSTSKYAEEGFSTWMEARMVSVASQRVAAGRPVDEPVRELSQAVHSYPPDRVLQKLRELGDPGIDSLADAIEFLSQAGPADRQAVVALMSGRFPHTDLSENDVERDQALDQLSSELFGQPLHYVVGYVLVEKLERRLGARSVPFALALAGNVSYGLDTVSNSDLRRALGTNPQLRMDVRLALIGTLEGVPENDPDALFAAARRDLSLTPPPLLPKKELF